MVKIIRLVPRARAITKDRVWWFWDGPLLADKSAKQTLLRHTVSLCAFDRLLEIFQFEAGVISVAIGGRGSGASTDAYETIPASKALPCRPWGGQARVIVTASAGDAFSVW